MKKISLLFTNKEMVLLAVILAFSSELGFSQKFGYIDSKLIIEELEEYKSAQKILEEKGKQWAKKLDDEKIMLQKLKEIHYAQQALLTQPERDQQRKNSLET